MPKMSVQLVHLRCHLGITLILATKKLHAGRLDIVGYKLPMCDCCSQAGLRKLKLVTREKMIHQPVLHDPSDLAKRPGDIVSIDWEFFGEEAICTKHSVNLLLVDHHTDDKWAHTLMFFRISG